MHVRNRDTAGTSRRRCAAMAVIALVGVILPVVAFGTLPADAATVPVTLDCGDYDGSTFPITDLTVAQGDTVEVTWDEECVHPTLDETVLRTGATVADTYFSTVPGQASGVQNGVYQDIVPGASSGTWVVAYDAPLGQMPLNTDMEDSWPSACSNCGLGAALRLTVTPGPTVPDAPAAPTGTIGDGSVTLSWSAPDDDGGLPITGYEVTASPGGATCTSTAPVTSCTIDGLTNGEAYTFTVVASNAVGDSGASESSAALTPSPGVPASTTTTSAVPSPTSATPTRAAQPAAALKFVG